MNRLRGRPFGLPVLLVALVLVAVAAFAPAAFGQGAQSGTITLTTRPDAGEIVPDEMEAPTKFIIEAKGPGGAALRNALIDFEITAPRIGPLVSSDIPAIEGTTLFKSRFGAPDGKLEFDYVVPIRGDYTVKVQALPGPGATFQPISRELKLNVKERASEGVYVAALVAGLFVFGLLAGAVLGYANRGLRRA